MIYEKPEFAVIDVETTGVGNKDRVVEIAVVVLDDQLDTIDEYDTLVDPMRDVGPVNVHGITPSMLANAPTFEEVAAAIRERIHGRVIVAHNLVFDQRMMKNEYARLHADLLPGRGVCTLRQTGENLFLACKRYGVELTTHHRALADARATAQLLRRVLEDDVREVAKVENLTHTLNPRTLRREASGANELPVLARMVTSVRYPTSDGALLCYLNALDWVLDDLVITSEEKSQLIDLSAELSLSTSDVADANRRYLASMIQAAWRDGIITTAENELIAKVAELLNVREFVIPEVTEMRSYVPTYSAGTRVCFTGTATDGTGNKIERRDLEVLAAKMGLQPVSSVTKKNCDLLVAADPESRSGKAGKARSFEIPIVSVAEFLNQARAESI